MSPVLILLTFLLPSGAGAEEIIGGHEVKPHSRPYMAFIQFVRDDGKKGRCGGFLVRDNFVLTAAHCLGSSMKVTLGAHNIKAQEETQQIIPVAKAIPHPAYNPMDYTNDIMLLKGDSGGPLVCDNRAYGVVSYGKSKRIAPGIFTKVVSFLQWIKRSMKPV
ncbi:granzyme F-like isoform X3 [Mesocricetus auratus]|uniref:Granzyme F-like isoform X3 n=1 Tax=Mesocricetus auratus TaxID=10036 RepID=A0ABM2X155_MESAU|nr:granzyme F-like isoform X3 [Mesocricetus auratus]